MKIIKIVWYYNQYQCNEDKIISFYIISLTLKEKIHVKEKKKHMSFEKGINEGRNIRFIYTANWWLFIITNFYGQKATSQDLNL